MARDVVIRLFLEAEALANRMGDLFFAAFNANGKNWRAGDNWQCFDRLHDKAIERMFRRWHVVEAFFGDDYDAMREEVTAKRRAFRQKSEASHA